MSEKPPSLGTAIFLYTAGIFLVILAGLLLLQAFGVIQGVSSTVYIALLLLAVGSGFLYGIGTRS